MIFHSWWTSKSKSLILRLGGASLDTTTCRLQMHIVDCANFAEEEEARGRGERKRSAKGRKKRNNFLCVSIRIRN